MYLLWLLNINLISFNKVRLGLLLESRIRFSFVCDDDDAGVIYLVMKQSQFYTDSCI